MRTHRARKNFPRECQCAEVGASATRIDAADASFSAGARADAS
jgi:hypothetical protein